MTEPPSYPKTSRDQLDEPSLHDGKRARSPMILVVIIVAILLILVLALHIAGVVGPGTNM